MANMQFWKGFASGAFSVTLLVVHSVVIAVGERQEHEETQREIERGSRQ
jgi:hypothetical protein